MFSQQDDKQKKIDNILEELHRVLDGITSDKNDITTKVDKKVETETSSTEEEICSSQKENKSETNSLNTSIDRKQDNVSLDTKFLKEGQKKPDEVLEIKQETKFVEYQQRQENIQPQQLSEVELENEKDIVKIKTVLFYPSNLEDIKDRFLNNLNSTLKKVSKRPIKLVLFLCKSYDSLEKNLLLQFNQILESIKNEKIDAFFLIVNEMSLLDEDFVKKMSSYVCVSKSISYKDLDLKSTYLDISIDLLLITR